MAAFQDKTGDEGRGERRANGETGAKIQQGAAEFGELRGWENLGTPHLLGKTCVKTKKRTPEEFAVRMNGRCGGAAIRTGFSAALIQ
jgi:hypothetical protein